MQHTATYSPEDNKLRLYVGRVPRDEYEALLAGGWVSTPKQDCDFVAPWTPEREDMALSYLDDDEDIGDEGYSPEERAADRAERFEGYRDKRRDEAGGYADGYEAGPSAFGHQNRSRAERLAARHDRHRGRALTQWGKAEYWQVRTAGVIRNALYKSAAGVRRGRLLRLEAEQRKHEASLGEHAKRYRAWQKVLTLEGVDEIIFGADGDILTPSTVSPAVRLAYALASDGRCWGEYKHPRMPRMADMYSLMTDHQDPITAREAATAWLAGRAEPGSDPDSYMSRWARHYELRIAYEKAMLADEGGMVAEVEMEVGGWIGNHQIHGLNKSPATGRVVSVKLWLPDRWDRGGPPSIQSRNIERLPEGAYRPPTDEERAAFVLISKAIKAEAKAKKGKTIPLVNPTDEDADRLMALWNASGHARHKERHKYELTDTYEPSVVRRMTQAQYSAMSKGTYSNVETRVLHDCGRLSRRSSNMYSTEGEKYDKSLGDPVCKLRTSSGKGWYAPQCIIILTDKPQTKIPMEVEELAAVPAGGTE